MGAVFDIDSVHRLVSQIRRELEEHGSAQVEAHELRALDADIKHWRRAARRAGRWLGRPIKTGATNSGAWAVLTDWPAGVPNDERGLPGQVAPVSSDVADLDSRRDPLAHQLHAELVEHGSASIETRPGGPDVADWRAAARRAARQLGRPVRTGCHPDQSGAWAALTDWPATPQEAAIHQARMRRAIESLPTFGVLPPDED